MDDSSCSPEDKRQKDSSYLEGAILEAFNMAEGLATEVDLYLFDEVSKPDKFDDREVCLNNLTTYVYSIEESVRKLERDVSVLDSKFKNTYYLVRELKESLNFLEEQIIDIKKD